MDAASFERVYDSSDFPKQGRKSAGWPGSTAAGWARWPTPSRDVLGLRQSLGRALVDKRLYLPESWTSDPGRCAAARVPEDRREYRSKT